MSERNEVSNISEDTSATIAARVKSKLLTVMTTVAPNLSDLQPDSLDPTAEPVLPNHAVSWYTVVSQDGLTLPYPEIENYPAVEEEKIASRSQVVLSLLDPLVARVPSAAEHSEAKPSDALKEPEVVHDLRVVDFLLDDRVRAWMLRVDDLVFNDLAEVIQNKSLPEVFTSQDEMKRVAKHVKHASGQKHETDLPGPSVNERGEKVTTIYAVEPARSSLVNLYGHNPNLPLTDAFTLLDRAYSHFSY